MIGPANAALLAVIGLALAGPHLVRTATGALADHLPARISAVVWLAVNNARGYALRTAGAVAAMGMVVTLGLSFVVLPRRWVVERTFAWLVRYRRLARIYERKPAHHEAVIWWATVHQMTRRLSRELAGLPPSNRWRDPPPLPVLSSPDRRGKVLQLLAAQPWRAWRGSELAAILGIENVNSFRVQLSQWSHQGYIKGSQ